MKSRRDTRGRFAAEHVRRRGYDAPLERQFRPEIVEPLPATPIAEQFAEMSRNDPEFIAWIRAERQAEWIR